MCVGEGRTEVLGRGGEEEGGEWDWWEAENHGSEGGRNRLLGEANWLLGRLKLAAGGGRNWLLGRLNWRLGRLKLAAGEAETGGCEAENAVRD